MRGREDSTKRTWGGTDTANFKDVTGHVRIRIFRQSDRVSLGIDTVQKIGFGSPVEASLPRGEIRSEEHTSELQSLMRISYAVFCLKKKNTHNIYMTNKKHITIKT